FETDVETTYGFNSWIVISSTGYPIRKKLSDYIYVKNIGKNPDSYSVIVQTTPGGLIPKILNNIADVGSGRVDFSVMDVSAITKTDDTPTFFSSLGLFLLKNVIIVTVS